MAKKKNGSVFGRIFRAILDLALFAAGEAARWAGKGALAALKFLGAPLLPVLIAAAVFALVALSSYKFAEPSGEYVIKTVDSQIPPELADDIAKIKKDYEGKSLYKPGILRKIAADYAAVPWVEKVTAVYRDFPNRSVVVEFILRKQFAQVAASGGAGALYYYFVDRSGVRLPVRPQSAPVGRYLVVENVGGGIPTVGEKWDDAGLNDALEIYEKAQDFLDRSLKKATIQLTTARLKKSAYTDNRGGAKDIELLTSAGFAIQWGWNARAGEYKVPSTDAKLANLKKVLESNDVARIGAISLVFETPGVTYK